MSQAHPSAPRPGHVFGPVPSRRLGRSLGVDLVPYKTCSYDCIYCQLGVTTRKTLERCHYTPVAQVLDEVRQCLEAGPRPDYITLSGSGEPTLCLGLAELIAGIKSLTSVPVAVLTNGSLLWQSEVVGEIAAADLVIPSLDAADEAMFATVNRPCAGLTFEQMVSGLRGLRQGFAGLVWLEVFLLDGLSAAPDHADALAELARGLEPDRIQLNSVARPPAETTAKGVSFQDLNALAALFGDTAEVIMDLPPEAGVSAGKGNAARVLELLRRRPCSLQDIATGLAMHPNEVLKYTAQMTRDGVIELCETARGAYYRPTGRDVDETAASR